MSSFSDEMIAIARVYSSAMLDLAQQKGEADSLLQELQSLAALVETDDAFRDFLSSPLVDADKRRDSLDKMFRGRASDLLVDALQVLNRKGRIGLLPAVAATFQEEHLRQANRVEARVTSAIPLNDDQRQRLVSSIEAKTGRQATLIEAVDADLLGGMIVQIGDQKSDSSVATQLANLSEKLLTRASRQIQSGAHVEN
ncbi:MAG: ATP synthase F1 subunit delta [Acidobacteriota bacterium]